MAGGDWTPSELGSSILTAWFKADSISGSDGDGVSAWADSSGNGNDTSQGTAIRQPTLQTNELGGQPVVRFDGTNDILSDGDIAALDVLPESSGASPVVKDQDVLVRLLPKRSLISDVKET